MSSCHYDIHMKAFLATFNHNSRNNSDSNSDNDLFLTILMNLERDHFLSHACFAQGYF